jgi:hypothetical protein
MSVLARLREGASGGGSNIVVCVANHDDGELNVFSLDDNDQPDGVVDDQKYSATRTARLPSTSGAEVPITESRPPSFLACISLPSKESSRHLHDMWGNIIANCCKGHEV